MDTPTIEKLLWFLEEETSLPANVPSYCASSYCGLNLVYTKVFRNKTKVTWTNFAAGLRMVAEAPGYAAGMPKAVVATDENNKTTEEVVITEDDNVDFYAKSVESLNMLFISGFERHPVIQIAKDIKANPQYGIIKDIQEVNKNDLLAYFYKSDRPEHHKIKDESPGLSVSKRRKAAKLDYDNDRLPSNVCKFCYKNGERRIVYASHVLKSPHGEITCPILRNHTCEICGASEGNAHTRSHCPFNKKPIITNKTCHKISKGVLLQEEDSN